MIVGIKGDERRSPETLDRPGNADLAQHVARNPDQVIGWHAASSGY
jgi:hypothetical protein